MFPMMVQANDTLANGCYYDCGMIQNVATFLLILRYKMNQFLYFILPVSKDAGFLYVGRLVFANRNKNK